MKMQDGNEFAAQPFGFIPPDFRKLKRGCHGN